MNRRRNSPERIRQSEGRIRIAIQRLATNYILHTRLLEQSIIRCRPSVRTMAITIWGDDLLLFHNPQFVLSLPMNQLLGVLLHETHHVFFGHILADEKDYPDVRALTVAQEVTCNEFIQEPLPKGVLRLGQFRGLPPLESTEERYRRLTKHRRPDLSANADSPHGSSKLFPAGRAGETRDQSLRPPDHQKSTSGQAASNRGTGPRGRWSGGVLDDHSVWKESIVDTQQAEGVVRAAIQGAVSKAGAANVPGYLGGAFHEMRIGNLAGLGQEPLTGDAHGQLGWRQLLRHYVGQIVAVRPDFTRPSRRCPEWVGIVPGRRLSGRAPKIMAVIDTSGSITPALLELIGAELARLAALFDVDVVECDAEIHRIYRYKRLTSVEGRGGTDLRPPFEPEFLRQHRPDLIVYFTDGEGPAPESKPRPPVIWCLTADGVRPASWGRVIKMEETATGNGSRR